jgi:hypothetical protein
MEYRMDAQNSVSDWYYVLDGQRQGPVPNPDIVKLVQSGTIKPETLVWNGEGDWVAAEKTVLSSLFMKKQPPPLPVSTPKASSPPPLPMFSSVAEHSKTPDDQIIRTFVGPKIQYYQDKWSKITNDKKVSWNWAAFLFNFGWAAYRKMYAYSFGTLGAILVVESILTFVKAPDWLINLIAVPITVVLGLFGNFLYKNHADKRIAEAKSLYPEKNQFDAFIIKTGGTSVVSLVVTYGTFILVMFIVSYIQATTAASTANATPSLSTTTQSSKSTSSKIDIPEFLVDFDKYVGKNVKLHGYIIAMGEEQVILYEALGSANTIYLNISALSSEDRKNVLRNCGSGCEATVIGTPAEVSYQKGLLVSQVF